MRYGRKKQAKLAKRRKDFDTMVSKSGWGNMKTENKGAYHKPGSQKK